MRKAFKLILKISPNKFNESALWVIPTFLRLPIRHELYSINRENSTVTNEGIIFNDKKKLIQTEKTKYATKFHM